MCQLQPRFALMIEKHPRIYLQQGCLGGDYDYAQDQAVSTEVLAPRRGSAKSLSEITWVC
jgi:hypothetical protein